MARPPGVRAPSEQAHSSEAPPRRACRHGLRDHSRDHAPQTVALLALGGPPSVHVDALAAPECSASFHRGFPPLLKVWAQDGRRATRLPHVPGKAQDALRCRPEICLRAPSAVRRRGTGGCTGRVLALPELSAPGAGRKRPPLGHHVWHVMFGISGCWTCWSASSPPPPSPRMPSPPPPSPPDALTADP